MITMIRSCDHEMCHLQMNFHVYFTNVLHANLYEHSCINSDTHSWIMLAMVSFVTSRPIEHFPLSHRMSHVSTTCLTLLQQGSECLTCVAFCSHRLDHSCSQPLIHPLPPLWHTPFHRVFMQWLQIETHFFLYVDALHGARRCTIYSTDAASENEATYRKCDAC